METEEDFGIGNFDIITPTPKASDIWKMLIKNQQQMITLQQQQLDFQSKTDKKLDELKDILSQAKGGWKVLIATGILVSACLTYVATHSKVVQFFLTR